MLRIIEMIHSHGPVPDKLKTDGEGFPGDVLPVLAPDRNKKPSAYAMHWGYQCGKRLIFNARSETAAQKPMFSEGLKQHRCIIPVAGYYEWSPDKTKYAIHPSDSMTFLAGIYRNDGDLSFTVLTREPGASTSFIHPRMPVILPQKDIRSWLDPDADPGELLRHSLTEMICVPVPKEARS